MWAGVMLLMVGLILLHDYSRKPNWDGALFMGVVNVSWVLLVLGGGVYSHRQTPLLREQTLLRQHRWLEFACRINTYCWAWADDPSEETHRWDMWLNSPHRDPAAPAPELDAKWMASHARE